MATGGSISGVFDGAETRFAPAGRVAPEKLAELTRLAAENAIVRTVLEAVQGYLMILNRERQVLAANQELLQALGCADLASLAGLRPGEVMGCVHFAEGPAGCGTSEHCRSCGAVLAILSSQETSLPAVEECRMSIERDGRPMAVDFRVRATPLHLGGHELLAFVLQDVSSLKRKEVFERTFLHDFLNDIAGIELWGELLQEVSPESAARKILAISHHLKEEVLFQRALLQAENGELPVHMVPSHAREILDNLQTVFGIHKALEGKHLLVLPASEDAGLRTDTSLLLRILVNMVKNGLEATPQGGVVRVWFEWHGKSPGFVVQNEEVIPPGDRHRIFQRSFSTKGQGRGIGTFSMKLFGEGYLGGRVSFSSDEKRGTRFSIVLPEFVETLPEGEGNTAGKGVLSNGHKTEAGTPDAGSTPVGGTGSSGGKTVLLVEDEETILVPMTRMLQLMGFEVRPFRDGFTALEFVRAGPGALAFAITDLSLPRMDGLELARRLLEINPEMPVLLYTGFSSPGVMEEAGRVGVRDVLLKPLSMRQLKDRFRHLGLLEE